MCVCVWLHPVCQRVGHNPKWHCGQIFQQQQLRHYPDGRTYKKRSNVKTTDLITLLAHRWFTVAERQPPDVIQLFLIILSAIPFMANLLAGSWAVPSVCVCALRLCVSFAVVVVVVVIVCVIITIDVVVVIRCVRCKNFDRPANGVHDFSLIHLLSLSLGLSLAHISAVFVLVK